MSRVVTIRQRSSDFGAHSAEKKTTMNAFYSKIIGNWLEPEKMAKESAATPAAKKRYHGSS